VVGQFLYSEFPIVHWSAHPWSNAQSPHLTTDKPQTLDTENYKHAVDQMTAFWDMAPYCLAMMLEVVHTSDTRVCFYETTWCQIAKGSHHWENLKYQFLYSTFLLIVLWSTSPSSSLTHSLTHAVTASEAASTWVNYCLYQHISVFLLVNIQMLLSRLWTHDSVMTKWLQVDSFLLK
jgi:hypothetical protein